MKTKKYILFALAALLTVSCHDNGKWDAPDPDTGMASVGNQNLIASNPKTIAEIKAMFNTEIKEGGLKQVRVETSTSRSTYKMLQELSASALDKLVFTLLSL